MSDDRLSYLELVWRWVVCKVAHTGRVSEWTFIEVKPGVFGRTFKAAWCLDCDRPLRENERVRCDRCGQPVEAEQWPQEPIRVLVNESQRGTS